MLVTEQNMKQNMIEMKPYLTMICYVCEFVCVAVHYNIWTYFINTHPRLVKQSTVQSQLIIFKSI